MDSEEEEEEEEKRAKKKGKVRLERTTRMLVLEHEQKRQDRTVSLCSHESCGFSPSLFENVVLVVRRTALITALHHKTGHAWRVDRSANTKM